jgi:hypothetical protein
MSPNRVAVTQNAATPKPDRASDIARFQTRPKAPHLPKPATSQRMHCSPGFSRILEARLMQTAPEYPPATLRSLPSHPAPALIRKSLRRSHLCRVKSGLPPHFLTRPAPPPPIFNSQFSVLSPASSIPPRLPKQPSTTVQPPSTTVNSGLSSSHDTRDAQVRPHRPSPRPRL